jgi:hypothetical protein
VSILGAEKQLAIERCDKCGKAFMSRTEVERHKVYEHPVPVSPFEQRFAYDNSRASTNGEQNIEDLQKMKSDVMTSIRNNNSNDGTEIHRRQTRKVPFSPFRI